MTEYYDLVYEYRNDCLVAGINYNKTYYQDRDLEPTEDFVFSIKLIPLLLLTKNLQIRKMYFKKKLEVFVIIFFILASNGQHLNAIENKILFKVDNEIITSIDIYDEIKFLKAFNPEMNSLNNNELFEISKNSILRDKIKKIEIMNFVEELIVDDKFILNLIRKILKLKLIPKRFRKLFK